MSAIINSIKTVIYGVLAGIRDSIVGIAAIKKIHERNELSNTKSQQNKSENQALATLSYQRKQKTTVSRPKQTFSIYQRLIECCGLNVGVFASSIIIFNYILLPTMFELMKLVFGHEGRVVRVWSWLNPILLYTFGAFWVLPLFMLSRLVNAFWFQDIAECTLRGRSQTYRSVSSFIADTLFSLLIQALFLIQSVMVGNLFYIGPIVSLLHLSLLYSLYSFEYKWFNNGWELHRRLNFIESNWPYFVGFGLPLAILTSIPQSYLLSGSIFSTLFPLFIVSSNEARPVRSWNLSLQLFAPVVFLSSRIFQFTIQLSGTAQRLLSAQR